MAPGPNNANNRIFSRTKESIDKHVTIDLYQAVYGDESYSTSQRLAAGTTQPTTNNTGTVNTVPVSSNTSKGNSPQRKMNPIYNDTAPAQQY